MLVGSLTSTFYPPAACVSHGLQVIMFRSGTSQDDYHYYLTVGPGAAGLGTASCFPSSQFPSSGNYYSPGICPSGYSAACTLTGGNADGNSPGSTVTCCRAASFSLACNTQSVGVDWGVFADCTTQAPTLTVAQSVIGAVPTFKLTDSSRDLAGNLILTNAVVNGYGIEVRWQQTDEALLFGTAQSSSGLSSIPTATSSSLPAETAGKSVTPSNHGTGVIAGAVLGSVVGSILLIGLAVVKWRSKKKQEWKQQRDQSVPSHDIYEQNLDHGHLRPVGELPGAEVRGDHEKSELPVPAPSGVIQRRELDATPSSRQELDADSTRELDAVNGLDSQGFPAQELHGSFNDPKYRFPGGTPE
ncbi:hypothetical protein F4778DRAFT_784535 [Xylariomycetidae sp. FL2044]|nr:hypothetical protein F4778DRAFT_784535 [Xylariomycetidae sp. FL2044]